jgi:hypothetical protein
MFIYEIMVSELDNSEIIKRTNEDGSESWIPKDEGNADYQRYLNPEAEQSTPMVTEEAATD